MSGFTTHDDKGAILGAQALGAGVAPNNATYITQVAESLLTSEQALASLATGLLKNTTSTGVLTVAAESDVEGALGSHAANEVLATPDGSTGQLSPRLLALKDLPSQLSWANAANEASDFTTNSTSFVSIGATNFFKKTLTTKKQYGLLLATFTVKLDTVARGVFFDIEVDGTSLYGNDGLCEWSIPNVTGLDQLVLPVSIAVPITLGSSGSHTVEIKWKVRSTVTVTMYAGAGTTNHDLHPSWAIVEI